MPSNILFGVDVSMIILVIGAAVKLFLDTADYLVNRRNGQLPSQQNLLAQAQGTISILQSQVVALKEDITLLEGDFAKAKENWGDQLRMANTKIGELTISLEGANQTLAKAAEKFLNGEGEKK